MYMDVLIELLRNSGYGCNLHGVYIGCLCYADDIVLISHSIYAMQCMLNICEVFAGMLDVKFNSSKSVAMRVGSRFECKCADLTLCGSVISYVQSVKYLGVCFKAGKFMVCNFDQVKRKFYRAFNSIYSRSHSANSELVTVELFKAYCLPVLLYAVEVLPLRASEFRSLDNCINVVVAKVFKLSTIDNVQAVRTMIGLYDIRSLVVKRRSRFLDNLDCVSLFQNYSVLHFCICSLF